MDSINSWADEGKNGIGGLGAGMLRDRDAGYGTRIEFVVSGINGSAEYLVDSNRENGVANGWHWSM